MILFSLAVVSAIGHFRSIDVRVPSGVTTVNDVVLDLANDLKIKITVPKALSRHLIYLDQHGQSPRSTLEALALCIRGSITESNGEIMIQRVEKDLQRVRNEQCLERGKALGKKLEEIDRYRVQQLAGKTLVQGISEAIELRSKQYQDLVVHRLDVLGPYDGRQLLPCQSLLEKLIKRIGVEELAKSCVEHTQMFERNPAPGALALPECDDLLTEYQDMISQLRSSQPSMDVKRTISLPVFRTDEFSAWIGKGEKATRLRLTVGASCANLALNLQLFDERGMIVDSTNIDSYSTEEYNWQYPNVISKFVSTKPVRTFIELAPDAQDACTWKLRDPILLPDWLSHPTINEPFAVFVEPIMRKIASEAPNTCVVIDLSDALWHYGSTCTSADKLDVDAFKVMMTKWGYYEHVEVGSAGVWRPKYFDYTEARDADRKALEIHAKTFAHLRRRDFRSVCKLFHDAGPAVGDLTSYFGSISTGQWGESWNLDNQFISLIGGISDADWSSLESGRSLSVAELELDSAFDKLLRDGQTKIESPQGVSDYDQHPSELYRDRSLGETAVAIRKQSNEVFHLWQPSKEKEPNNDWMDLQRLTAFSHVSYGGVQNPGLQTTRDEFESQLKRFYYRIASAINDTVILTLPKGCLMKCEAPQELVDKSGVIQYDEFPADLRDQIWDAACASAKRTFERRKRAIDAAKSGLSGGLEAPSTPPPT